MRLRDYGGSWEFYGSIKTPAQAYYVPFGTVASASKHSFLWRVGTEDPIPCRGLSATIRAAKNTFRVSIPRACVHRPRWVRMGLEYIVCGKAGDFLDDSLRKGDGVEGAPLTARLDAG